MISFGNRLRQLEPGIWSDGKTKFYFPTFDETGILSVAGATITGLTASRLVATDGTKLLVSESISDWLTGSGGASVTDDGDGTATITVAAVDPGEFNAFSFMIGLM